MLTFFIIKNLTTDLLFYTILISSAFFLFFTTLKELFKKKFNNIKNSCTLWFQFINIKYSI